ncbi:hypothetical protein [Streptomyces thermodiastaticus]|uniref:hypothetical protein n=1 Tax=Streptomyces thermodiastaticus TaxID=44061 RepID=UPI0016755277|nr:hypothetical protein [Streptomyces thermodiastaticus]MCE7551872.1 hypothetical protein [Streptomyces thermodiastaticus]GHF79597.1 hypothetical protein GCM10018787_30470 [Streptomyces thermodiastaticus]
MDALLTDPAASVAAARASEPVTVDPALAELAAGLDPDALTAEKAARLPAFPGLDAARGLSSRTAPVPALLDSLPPRLKERMLTEFIGLLPRI